MITRVSLILNILLLIAGGTYAWLYYARQCPSLDMRMPAPDTVRIEVPIQIVPQREIRRRTGTAALAGTTIVTSTRIDTVIAHDTTYLVDTDSLFVGACFSNEWVDLEINAGIDSTHLSLSMRDRITLHKQELEGITYITASNANPYARIDSIEALEIKPKPLPRIGLGLSAGIGYTPAGLQPLAAVTVTYNLIYLDKNRRKIFGLF